ncbi:class I SAM-dependent methyltransferase [Leptospira terpstrae]|uniref:Methyltransferase domain protein n=1 Tax=Leptospira terpstrae serovar Hualin str. LT 11-33 = ATCC 700639 TaxID=1257025 RepID=N1VU43_9LEPT|nr:class I SAM-dependent methyltransferase [Leptospira terpstrae]EMY61973.1 methyltransferase domain protein [Leptospira terpstrae serovar Hualin str. LT 11-33 = ATCC 700639]
MKVTALFAPIFPAERISAAIAGAGIWKVILGNTLTKYQYDVIKIFRLIYLMNPIKKQSNKYSLQTFVCFFVFSFCFLLTCDQNSSPEQVAFEKVYDEKKWGDGSGIGSWPENAGPYLKLLQESLNDPKYTTIVDLGCGDWKLMETLSIPEEKKYVGYDLVTDLIAQNTKKYSKKNVKFLVIKQLSDIRNVSADLLIVKDVLHHWPIAHINYFLKEILPNYRYALITNDYNFFASNQDIAFAEFRPINLQKEPFLPVIGLRVLFDYPSHGIIKRVYLYQNPAF